MVRVLKCMVVWARPAIEETRDREPRKYTQFSARGAIFAATALSRRSSQHDGRRSRRARRPTGGRAQRPQENPSENQNCLLRPQLSCERSGAAPPRCRVSMSALGSAHDSAHGGSRDRETAKDILHEVLHPHTKPSAVAVQYPNNVTCIDNDAAMRTEAEARGHPEISGCIDVGGMCIDVDGIGAVARKICCSTCTAPGAPTQNLPSPSTGPVDIFFLAGQSGCVGLSSVAKLKASGRYSSLEREQPKVWFAGYHGVQSPEMFSISPMSPSALPPSTPPPPSTQLPHLTPAHPQALAAHACAPHTPMPQVTASHLPRS